MNANRKAFLSMIAVSEGTKDIGDDGYNLIVGGSIFTDYSVHPNVRVRIHHNSTFSTAAGRYQIIYRNWFVYKNKLCLKDFSPDSQDLIAIELIRECNALSNIDEGQIELAIHKCKSRWASFPDAGYNQKESSLPMLLTAYKKYGGIIK